IFYRVPENRKIYGREEDASDREKEQSEFLKSVASDDDALDLGSSPNRVQVQVLLSAPEKKWQKRLPFFIGFPKIVRFMGERRMRATETRSEATPLVQDKHTRKCHFKL
ncbi:MAG: hypothetical protein J6A28_03975, partial [Clostridia bacterium]|nr:hypothetical protein [Clostridia bacterium]